MNRENFKKRYTITNQIFIRCHNCKKEEFVKSWYETKNNIYLCPKCYHDLPKTYKEFKDNLLT